MVCYWPRWLAKKSVAFYKIIFIKWLKDRLDKAQGVIDNLSKTMINMKYQQFNYGKTPRITGWNWRGYKDNMENEDHVIPCVKGI